MCKQESSPDKSTKIYTRKELVMMETTITDFPTKFYISAIQKWVFHVPHVRILGTDHCGEMRRTSFKRRELFQDVLCRCEYDKRVVTIFDNQIKPEHFGVNISMYIEGIALEIFSAVPKSDIKSSTISRQSHVVFNSFLSDNSKQDATTITAHSKLLI